MTAHGLDLGFRVFVALALVMVVDGAAPARAHSILTSSQPANGETVDQPPLLVLTFNSRVEKALSSLVMAGPHLSEVFIKDQEERPGANVIAFRLPPLAAGPYRVRWKILSADGHVVEGVLSFSVKAPATRP